jgi:hypothetical protein
MHFRFERDNMFGGSNSLRHIEQRKSRLRFYLFIDYFRHSFLSVNGLSLQDFRCRLDCAPFVDGKSHTVLMHHYFAVTQSDSGPDLQLVTLLYIVEVFHSIAPRQEKKKSTFSSVVSGMLHRSKCQPFSDAP